MTSLKHLAHVGPQPEFIVDKPKKQEYVEPLYSTQSKDQVEYFKHIFEVRDGIRGRGDLELADDATYESVVSDMTLILSHRLRETFPGMQIKDLNSTDLSNLSMDTLVASAVKGDRALLYVNDSKFYFFTSSKEVMVHRDNRCLGNMLDGTILDGIICYLDHEIVYVVLDLIVHKMVEVMELSLTERIERIFSTQELEVLPISFGKQIYCQSLFLELILEQNVEMGMLVSGLIFRSDLEPYIIGNRPSFFRKWDDMEKLYLDLVPKKFGNFFVMHYAQWDGSDLSLQVLYKDGTLAYAHKEIHRFVGKVVRCYYEYQTNSWRYVKLMPKTTNPDTHTIISEVFGRINRSVLLSEVKKFCRQTHIVDLTSHSPKKK